MKKMTKTLMAIALAVILCLGVTACGSQSEEQGEETQTPNPMTEVSKDQMVKDTTVDIDAPEGATDVKYFTIKQEDGSLMAHVAFRYNDKDFFYRANAGAIEIMDQTGLYADWTETKQVDVSYNKATLELADDCAGMYWYDAVPAINYSLGCEAASTEKEMVTLANQLFVPAQGEVGADMEGTSINGNSDSRDMVTIQLNNGGDDYDVTVEIHRLAELKGTGGIVDGNMEMILKDPEGNDMHAKFYKEDDGTFTFKVTESTWNYLQKGETVTGFAIDEIVQ